MDIRTRWVAAALIGMASIALAGESAGPDRPFAISGGLDLVSSYYWRGYLQEDSGLIAQPYLELDAKLHQQESLSLTPFVRTWNSVHSKTGSDAVNENRSNWYQSDLSAGMKVGVGDLQITPFYTLTFVSDTGVPSSPYPLFWHPVDRSDTVQEIAVRVAYDDSKLMQRAGSPVTLNPYLLYSWQLTNDILGHWPSHGPGLVSFGEEEGQGTYEYGAYYQRTSEQFQYLELGLVPTVALPNTQVKLMFPLALGMSPDGLYQDFPDSPSSSTWHDTWIGYWSAGLAVSVPLTDTTRIGQWTLTAGVTYLHLEADTVRMQNGGSYEFGPLINPAPGSTRPIIADLGSADVWIGRLGVAFVY